MAAIRLIYRNLLFTLRRYPVPILSGFLAFVFLLIEIHCSRIDEFVVHDYRFIKLFLACMLGISLFTAFDIFSESKAVENSKRLGLYLLGFSVLGLHYYSITPGMFDSDTVFVSRYLILFVCFHLLVSFIAFYSSSQIKEFWQYNYFLFKQIVSSLLYSTTLFVGLASAMWALDTLFTLQMNPDYYTDLAAFVFLVFNTIFFLMGMPKSYDEFASPMSYRKPIRLFVQYILLPIIGIYILILYLYVFRILIYRTLPDGYVCIPILIFSIVGILAYLLVYPIRKETNYRSIYLYSRYFFYILLPLLSLYFIGIVKRILPYGITEDRYLIFVLGVWLVIISVYIITSTSDNIIVVPVSLFLLLAISALGPWGMFQLSVSNQVYRLEHLLKRNHLLDNDKLVKLDKRYSISPADEASIRSIFSYLNKRGEILRIHPWLSDKDQGKLDSAIAHNDLYYIQSIFSDLGPDHTPYELHHYFQAKGNDLYQQTLSIKGYEQITHFSCGIYDATPGIADTTDWFAQLKHDTLWFSLREDTLFRIPMQSCFRSLLDNFRRTSAGLSNSNTLRVINAHVLNHEMPADAMRLHFPGGSLYLSSLEFTESDTLYQLQRVEGFLLHATSKP